MKNGVIVSIILLVILPSTFSLEIFFSEHENRVINAKGEHFVWPGQEHECTEPADCITTDLGKTKALAYGCRKLTCQTKIKRHSFPELNLYLRKPIRRCVEQPYCSDSQFCYSRFNTSIPEQFVGKCCPKSCASSGFTKLAIREEKCVCDTFRCDIKFSSSNTTTRQRLNTNHLWLTVERSNGQIKAGSQLRWFTFFNIKQNDTITFRTEIKDSLLFSNRTRTEIVAHYPGPAAEVIVPPFAFNQKESKQKGKILQNTIFKVTDSCTLKQICKGPVCGVSVKR